MSSKPKGRISSWPGASDGSAAGIEGRGTDAFVGISGGVVASGGGEDDCKGSDLTECLLKSERKMEANVSFRVLEALGVCWNSTGDGSVAAVALALSGWRDCLTCFSI